jgi:hypothetical protein
MIMLAGLQFHDEKDDVADQSAHGQHFDGGAVGCREPVPMSGQERLPGRFGDALRCGFDAGVFEDRLIVLRATAGAQTQPAAGACVAPGRVPVAMRTTSAAMSQFGWGDQGVALDRRSRSDIPDSSDVVSSLHANRTSRSQPAVLQGH